MSTERVDRLNSLLEAEIARLVSEEAPIRDGLITITQVKCSPDLESAKIGFSVIPSNLTGTALREVRNKSGVIKSRLARKLKIRRIPKLIWFFDDTEIQAEKMDRLFQQIEEDEENEEDDLDKI